MRMQEKGGHQSEREVGELVGAGAPPLEPREAEHFVYDYGKVPQVPCSDAQAEGEYHALRRTKAPP